MAYCLPGRLREAGDVAVVRRLAQAQPAEAELAVVGTRTTTPPAAVVGAGLVLGLSALLDDLRCLRHLGWLLALFACLGIRLGAGLGGGALALLALLVLRRALALGVRLGVLG